MLSGQFVHLCVQTSQNCNILVAKSWLASCLGWTSQRFCKVFSGMLYHNNDNNNNDDNNRIERCNLRLFTISSMRRVQSPTHTLKRPGSNRVQITCNTSSVYHMQHVVLRAMWSEGTAQLLNLTDFKSHLFELYFIGWTINWWRRGGNRSTQRKPLATSFRKCHILNPRDASPKWDSNPHNSISGRLGKQMW